MTDATNYTRRIRAEATVQHYARMARQDLEVEGRKTVATDLLADLMHWAESLGLDFEDMARVAATHYEAEKMTHLNIPAAINTAAFGALPDTPDNEARLKAALQELLDAQARLSTCARADVPAAVARHMEAIKDGRALIKELS